MRYMVKWKEDGEWKYGIFYSIHNKEAKGVSAIEDLILPQLHMVPTGSLVDVDWEETDPIVDAALEKARKLSDSLPDGLHVGKMLRLGVGDGYASYVVTKVSAKTATIEWRGFCADRWHDQVLGAGGTFARKIIEPLVSRHDAMRRLFAAK